MSGVYLSQPREGIATARRLLACYRAFLRSDCERMADPYDPWNYHRPTFPSTTLTKAEAQRKLSFILDVAINRKAGLPDSRGRKDTRDYQSKLWRDRQKVRDLRSQRVVIYQFETPEARKRFGHLLSDWRERERD